MPSLKDRFLAKVNQDGPVMRPTTTLGKCWVWTGNRSQGGKGYGQIWVEGRLRGAHIVAWFLAYGWPKPGVKILHDCDNRACVRLSHLYSGTQSQNILDMVRRGRCHNAKLSDADVRVIRASSLSSAFLAKQFGVHDGHIRKVRSGRVKSHVM